MYTPVFKVSQMSNFNNQQPIKQNATASMQNNSAETKAEDKKVVAQTKKHPWRSYGTPISKKS